MKSVNLKRREFLQAGAAGFLLFAAGRSLAAGADMTSLARLGSLQAPDENDIMLPPGFRSRVVARSGQPAAAGSTYLWHAAPDGGAVYAMDDGGWIYVSNSEMRNDQGGVGVLRFDASGEVIDSYPILHGTNVNCAGGKTPWQTWLSCEEIDLGRVYECDPTGRQEARVRPALGRFRHEAVAVDPVNQVLYMTEDKPDGGFYRFRPRNPLPDLSAGVLEIATLNAAKGRLYLGWSALSDPQAMAMPTRYQVPDYAPFNGGEGLVYGNGNVYFSTKGDNRVWSYDVASNELVTLYDVATADNPILSGVDNLTITPSGDVLVAEDRGDMQIVVLTPGGLVMPLLQVIGHAQSEITGPAFDPSHRRLYFSSQRGFAGNSESGITYEVSVV
jgi:secreted PhoX family phosphatase